MIVVKFGGHAMRDENGGFARAIGFAIEAGEKFVIVHGGGPQIDAALKLKGITSKWIDGLRVTSQEIFNVVEHVLVNEVGPEIVASLEGAGIRAEGMSARTLPTVIAERRTKLIDGLEVDFGLVGYVKSVNPADVLNLLNQGIVPVIAPISSEADLKTGLNVNADFVAASIAASIEATSLIIMTDVAGIYRNWPDKNSLIDSISADELASIEDSFTSGMAPKVKSALDALSYGARSVRIIDGRDSKNFVEALSGRGGTLVTR